MGQIIHSSCSMAYDHLECAVNYKINPHCNLCIHGKKYYEKLFISDKILFSDSERKSYYSKRKKVHTDKLVKISLH